MVFYGELGFKGIFSKLSIKVEILILVTFSSVMWYKVRFEWFLKSVFWSNQFLGYQRNFQVEGEECIFKRSRRISKTRQLFFLITVRFLRFRGRFFWLGDTFIDLHQLFITSFSRSWPALFGFLIKIYFLFSTFDLVVTTPLSKINPSQKSQNQENPYIKTKINPKKKITAQAHTF